MLCTCDLDLLLAVALRYAVAPPLSVDLGLILAARPPGITTQWKIARETQRTPSGSWLSATLMTTDQSPTGSMSLNKRQSTANQSHNTVAEEERANRFDRALLREQVVDRNSPRKELVGRVSKHQNATMFGNISAEQIELTRHNGHHMYRRRPTCARRTTGHCHASFWPEKTKRRIELWV